MKFEKWIYFFDSDFVGVNRLFVLTYTNEDAQKKTS